MRQKEQATGVLITRKSRGCLGGHRWVGDELRYWGSATSTEIKTFASITAEDDAELYKGDLPNAYTSALWPIIDGKRLRVLMSMFRGHVRYDDNGAAMIYEVM